MSEIQIANAVRSLEGKINNLQSLTVETNNRIGNVESTQRDTQAQVATLVEMFNRYVEQDTRDKALSLAETRIIKVRNELETVYGHYSEVRKSATGLLQAFDVGMVTDGTVRSVTEEMMIKAPQYWLAPVLVAIAAWSRDDRALAEKALEEALRRDVDKTALFFTLVLRRYERAAASARWLDQFFARQDPGALDREFVIILEGAANGAFGAAARDVVATHVDNWLSDFGDREEFTRRQVDRWLNELRLLAPAVPTSAFPTLARASTTWNALASSLGSVRGHGVIGAKFDAIFEGEIFIPKEVQRQIDGLLDNLVTSFDDEELPLRRQEAELQAIVDARGDEERARKAFATVEEALQQTVDFPTLLTNAAMHPEVAHVSNGTQRLAIALSKEWVVAAHDQYTTEARAAVPMTVNVTFQTWSGEIQRSSDQDALIASAHQHIDRETEAAVAKIKFGGGALAAAIGGGLVTVIGLATLNVVLIVLGLAAGGWAFFQYKGLDKKRAAARAAGEERKKAAAEDIRNAITELTDYRIEWARHDETAETVRARLDSIRPSEHTLTRNETREVLR